MSCAVGSGASNGSEPSNDRLNIKDSENASLEGDGESTESPQPYSGIWMQLDVLLAREQPTNAWDKPLPRFPRLTPAGNQRKRDAVAKITSSRSKSSPPSAGRQRPIERTLLVTV